jgi:hypothetical protein
LRDVATRGVEVVVCPELLGRVGLVGAAGDGDGFEPELVRELHAQVAEAAQAEHRDEVAGAGRAAAQRAEGRHARAGQRSGLCRAQSVGDAGKGVRRHDRGIGVAARVGPARHLEPLAVDEVAVAAGHAGAAVAAEPADRHPLPGRPAVDVVADVVDAAGDLVTGDQGELHVREGGVDERRVGAAHAAGLDGDADLASAGLGQFALDDAERAAGLGDLGGSVRRHRTSPSLCVDWWASTRCATESTAGARGDGRDNRPGRAWVRHTHPWAVRRGLLWGSMEAWPIVVSWANTSRLCGPARGRRTSAYPRRA